VMNLRDPGFLQTSRLQHRVC